MLAANVSASVDMILIVAGICVCQDEFWSNLPLNIYTLCSVGRGYGIVAGPRRTGSSLGSLVDLPSDQTQDNFPTYKLGWCQLERVNAEHCVMVRYWYHDF